MARIVVVGGSGYIGRHIVEELVRQLHFVIVPTRRRERVKAPLIVLPTVEVVEADVHDAKTLERLFEGADAVINLVGILQGGKPAHPYSEAFRRAHVELPAKIVAASRAVGVPRLEHMSALQASPQAPSQYLRSKADGEAAVLAAKNNIAVTVFRPSVVFGAEDQFLNVFAKLQRYLPVMLLACPHARFQPVYVEDVAQSFVRALDDDDSHGRAYELVGPKVYTLRELVEYVGRVIAHPRPVIGLSDRLSYLQAWMMELLPGGLMSRDNYYSMQLPNISDAPLPFDIEATPLEAIAPTYLSGVYPRSRYSTFRYHAGRKTREV